MPRYIFSLADHNAGWNGDARELPDVQAAKCVAIRMISDTLCNDAQAFWDAYTHQVTVSDESGLTQFIVDITTTTSSAILPLGPSRPV